MIGEEKTRVSHSQTGTMLWAEAWVPDSLSGLRAELDRCGCKLVLDRIFFDVWEIDREVYDVLAISEGLSVQTASEITFMTGMTHLLLLNLRTPLRP